MPYRKRLAPLLISLLLPLALAACGEPEDTGPGKPVAHRRDAFKAILDAFEPMGIRLRANQYDADQFIAQAKQLNKVKEGPWAYFTPDSNYPPTHATAKVWSEAEKFDAGRQKFLAAVSQLATATETKDEAKVRAAYEALHDTCRSCHKEFKK